MNHRLILKLDQTTANVPGLRFALSLRNDSSAKLYLPFPEIICLQFRNDDTGQEAEYYTSSLVSAAGSGFTLQSGECREFDFRVRTSDVEKPVQDDFSDYCRWHVDLSAGDSSVRYLFKVDSDYFDPDSHWRLPDLEWHAEQEGAKVWLGEAASNRLQVFGAYPSPHHWPSTVVSLADALYQGQDCAFALHDTLLDAGHPELADHFRQEQWHPKGCWALDLILQKK